MSEISNTSISLEKNFMESLKKNTILIQVGCRHSGKTTWSCCLLRELMLADDFYDEYHFVLPTYDTGQQGGTFDWIKKLPKNITKKITIYCEFSLGIVDKLIEESDGKKNRFFYLDDATAETSLFSNESALKSLSTKARHYKITTLFCFHFLKRTVSTQLRNSAEWIIMHRATDSKLLEGIWEECASLFHDKDTFMEMCRDKMSDEFPCVVIWRDKGRIDAENGMNWSFQNKHRDIVLNKHIKSNEPTRRSKKAVCQIDAANPDTEHRGSEFEVPASPRNKAFISQPGSSRANKNAPRVHFRI